MFITSTKIAESHSLTYHAGSTQTMSDYILLTEPVIIGWNINAVPTTTQQIVEEKPIVYNNDTRILCNCYSYVKEVFSDLPNTSVIRNNITYDGNVAVFYYPTSGVYHYAVVTSRNGEQFTIDETNYRPCKLTQRELTLDYPYLLGFFKV